MISEFDGNEGNGELDTCDIVVAGASVNTASETFKGEVVVPVAGVDGGVEGPSPHNRETNFISHPSHTQETSFASPAPAAKPPTVTNKDSQKFSLDLV